MKDQRTNLLTDAFLDIKYALRTFRREPAFVIGVVLTFALIIGANAAAFGLVSRLMLAPPPGIRDANHVYHVGLQRQYDNGESYAANTISYPAFEAIHSRGAFVAVAAVSTDTMAIGRGENASRVAALGVTGEYFRALGATATAGRVLLPSDDALPDYAVVVLGYSYWKRAFNGERSIVGREILVDDRAFIVVGVAKQYFNGDGLGDVDLFVPLSALFANRSGDWRTNHHMNLVSIVARLREGVSPAMAVQLAVPALREEADASGSNTVPTLALQSLVPGRESRNSPQSRIALWLAAVSGIVLLIAAANVGTLLSLRSARRWKELAVRIALGAGSARIARHLVLESLLLAFVGASFGLLLSGWIAAAIRATLLPAMADVGPLVDNRVLAASIVVTLLAGVLAGLTPLWQLRRADLASGLRVGARQGSSKKMSLQHALMTVQVALCMVLLVAAGLFVRSLNRVQSQDLGFRTDRLLYATLGFKGYVAAVERDQAYEELVRRLNGVPGLTATVAAGIPFGPHNIPPVSIPGFSMDSPTAGQIPIMYGATPTYLDLMGVTLIAGRRFTDRDNRASARVVLVNNTLAQRAWRGMSPLGKCMRIGFGSPEIVEGQNPATTAACREVVGVVRDSRARSLRPERNEDRIMQYYVPFEQLPTAPFPDQPQVMGAIIRSTGDVEKAVGAVQRVVQSSALPAYARVHPYQNLIDPQLRSWRLGATLFSAFSALALAIAGVGLFGVVSYVVSQRTREIGIRLAIGGGRGRIFVLVVRDTLRMVVVGLAIGIAGALACGQLLASMLFQTSPYDAASIISAVAVLLLSALAASAIPAWRGGRVNPLVALRMEA